MDRADIVIVGGGLAGAAAIENYRKAGGTGSVALISQDTDLPVHRPPLSKEYLRGDAGRDTVFVHPPEFYRDNDIATRLDTRVDGIDLGTKQLTLSSGESYGFGTLVLATGARPRRLNLPRADLPGVFYLRSLASAEQLQAAYRDARQAVIIGAGFIGMEVAATLTQRGVACTVVEMGPRIWPRLVPDVTATFIQRYFEDRGVRFRLGVGVRALEGDDWVRSVVLDTAEIMPADLIVVGVGAVLNTSLAERASLQIDNGVVVDEYLRASHPDVYAIGDVTSFPDPVAGRIHLEHWDNALHQGHAVGQTLAGRPVPFDHVAYFFSDMFDLSLNMIGYPLDWEDIILRGDPEGGTFTTIYVKDGTVRAALMVNGDQHFDAWNALVRARQPVDGAAALLTDPDIDPMIVRQPDKSMRWTAVG